jgi:hypothetical protein
VKGDQVTLHSVNDLPLDYSRFRDRREFALYFLLAHSLGVIEGTSYL